MKIIHTADNHLGHQFVGLGPKGSALRAAQMDTFKATAELVVSEEADVLIIAGDAVDSNEVSSQLVKKTIRCFKELDPVPVLVNPGTHDVLDDTSVYHRQEFREVSNVHVFGIDGASFSLGDVTFHGRANTTKGGAVRPLKELRPDPEAAANVAVVHAGIAIPGKSSSDDFLVTQREIAKSGMDYVALGHWHSMGDFSTGGVQAWYPGAPEQLKFGEDGAGNVLLVELGNGKVTVEPHRVGRFTWVEQTIDVSKYPPGDPLESEILTSAGNNVLLKVTLKGVLPKGTEIDTVSLEDMLADEFFHLQIEGQGVGLPLEDLDSIFAAGTVGARYVQQLQEQIDRAQSSEERERLEKALYRGAGYLSGEMEVV